MTLFLLQGPAGGEYFVSMLPTFMAGLIFFNTFAAFAESTSTINWQEIKKLSDQGDLVQAAALLQTHPELESADYCYNFGTLQYRLKHFGEALAYLEKANRLRPHDRDIQTNLKLAQTEVARLIGQDSLDPSSRWSDQVASWLTPEEVQALTSLLGMLTLLLWIRNYLRTRNLAKSVVNFPSWAALSTLGASAALWTLQLWVESTPPVIALSRQVIRSGPGEQYMELGHVEAGSKLRLLGSSPSPDILAKNSVETSAPQQQTDVWKQIRYSGNGVGWIRSSGLLIL